MSNDDGTPDALDLLISGMCLHMRDQCDLMANALEHQDGYPSAEEWHAPQSLRVASLRFPDVQRPAPEGGPLTRTQASAGYGLLDDAPRAVGGWLGTVPAR